MPRVRTLLLFCLAVILLAVPVGAVWFYKQSIAAVKDCYAQERVAEMLVEHMERNGGAWPEDWNDLAEAFEICEARSGPTWATFEELREMCVVDFKAKPVEFGQLNASGDKAPFNVVRLASGKKHHWSGGEPNQRILQYLQTVADRPQEYSYPASPVESERIARQTLLQRGARWELNHDGHVVSVHMGSLQGSPRFADQHLELVADFTELKQLILDYSNITDTGLSHLSGLKNLQTLYLSNTRITDDGLRSLSDLGDLETLTLAFNKVGDAGLVHLRHLPSLKTLNLNYTSITDAGVEELCHIVTLEDIQVGDTKVTQNGAHRLKEVFPTARIYHRGP